MKQKHKNMIKLGLLNIAFIVMCFLALVPILYAVKIAFSDNADMLTGGASLIPRNVSLENFRAILFDKPFFLWLKNSLALSMATVILALFVSVPAAYAFSRFRFTGRKTLLFSILTLSAFPAILSMVALYRMLRMVGLMNSIFGLVLIYIGMMVVFSILNMKGYFDCIPIEIEEAASIDGAGSMGIITRIVLPLARPAIIVTAIMVLIAIWNEYIFAVLFLSGTENYTLAAGLYSLSSSDYMRNWPLFSAAAILASLPILVLFFMIQKYMASGLTAGGVKG